MIEIDLSDAGEPRLTIDDCSQAVIDKARAILSADQVNREASSVPDQYWFTVKDTYRVIMQTESGVPVWASCTCPHGTHTSQYNRIGCSHIAAAYMFHMPQR